MCHKVNNNRPVATPPPAAVSPERPTPGIQSTPNQGYNQNATDSFQRCSSAQDHQAKAQGVMKKLAKLFEKLEKYMPGIGDFLRNMLQQVQKQPPEVAEVNNRVARRAPALPAPR